MKDWKDVIIENEDSIVFESFLSKIDKSNWGTDSLKSMEAMEKAGFIIKKVDKKKGIVIASFDYTPITFQLGGENLYFEVKGYVKGGQLDLTKALANLIKAVSNWGSITK